MQDPSLVVVPYRYKATKLYSEIPITGVGDFTVGRLLNTATRVNSNGNIEVVNANIPRLDYYTTGGVAGCPALLVEPSAENLLLQSEAFNTTWSALNGATVTPNTTASPDNNVTADTINLSTTADSRVRQIITSSNSTTYTISCFFKNIALVAGETFRFRVNNAKAAPNDFIAGAIVDLAAGTATYFQTGTAGTGISGTGSASIENYGNGWFRVRATFTIGTAGGSATTLVEIIQPSASAARSFYAWGAQVEVGSVATSYIPTTTGSVTRNADVISVSGAVSGLIGQSEGTIYAEVDVRNITDSKAIIQSDDGTSDNRLVLFIGTSPIRIQFLINAAGANSVVSGIIATGINKIAVSYSSGSVQLYLNGSFLASGTPTTFPTVTRNNLSLGGRILLGVYGAQFNDRIRAVALYNSRLDDADLMVLTSPTYYSNVRDMIWDTFVARNSTFSELPGCLQTRHNELITL
jgi:hypothetical protein